MSKFTTLPASGSSVGLEEDVLSKDLEVRLVSREGEHDEIGVLKEKKTKENQRESPETREEMCELTSP